MSSSPTPEGLLRLRPPNLLDGFTDTFTSRYVDARELRMHGGHRGRRPAAPARARLAPDLVRLADVDTGAGPDVEVIAVDRRGIAPSDKPPDGYDAGTLTGDLVALMDALGHPRFALYATDTGMPIAYKSRRLTVSVLAIGGAERTSEGVAGTMLAEPTALLASNRDRGNRGVGEGAKDPSTASTTVIEETSIRPEGVPDV